MSEKPPSEEENTVLQRISKKKTYKFCVISIIIILISLSVGLGIKINLEINSKYDQVELNALFIHAEENFNTDLYDRLDLDEGINLKSVIETEFESADLKNIDILIVSNVDLSSSSISLINTFLKSSTEHSLILFMDAQTDGKDLISMNLTKSEELDEFKPEDNDIGYGVCNQTGEVSKLTNSIPWNTMPEIKKYTQLSESDFNKDDAKETHIILDDVSSQDSDDAFLFHKNLKNGGQVLLFTIWFSHELNVNEITKSFPYLGYFLYSCYMYLEDNVIPSYSAWPSSPIPHFIDLLLIGLLVGGLAIGSFLAFMYARNYSEKNPLTDIEALETEEEKKAKEKVKKKVKIAKEDEMSEEEYEDEIEKLEELKEVDYSLSFEEIEEQLPEHCRGWNAIGLHRQIGGFWTVLFLLLILVLPLLAFFLWIFPTFLFSSASGMGYYNFVGSFFGALWVFADFGTTHWMVRTFAAHRVSEPKKAIASAQCFLWFQMLTGAFQIVGVAFFGALIFPYTELYAYLSYVFVWYAIFQFLGFFWIFVEILNAFQRSDLANVSRAAMVPAFMFVQSTIVPLFIFIGAMNPEIGIALGAAIGASIANFTSYVILFFSTWYLYRKTLGYSGFSVFRVDFDWKMFKDMLKFGWKIAIGHTLIPLVMMLQVVLLSLYLNNYNNWLGYLNLGNILIQVYQVINFFAQSMSPALAEAKDNDKISLFNYNIDSMLKWVNSFNFWLSSALFAIGPILILTITPPEFQNLALLVPLLLIFSVLGPFSWMGDYVFYGSNFPNLARNAWILEQGMRAVLLIIFIPLFAVDPSIGIFSVYFAYIPALICKDVLVWWLIKKKVAPGLKLYPFKTFIAPALAGIVFYLLNFLILFATGGGLLGVIIAAAFALVLGPFVYFFLSGLFGGWSKNGLEEFERSISIMTLGGFVGRGLYKSCKAGANLSPWKENGNIEFYEDARIEAWELTLIKKKIENI